MEFALAKWYMYTTLVAWDVSDTCFRNKWPWPRLWLYHISTMGPKSRWTQFWIFLFLQFLEMLSQISIFIIFLCGNQISNKRDLWSDLALVLKYFSDDKDLFDKIKVYETWEENCLDLELSGFPCQCQTCTNKLHRMFLAKQRKKPLNMYIVHLPGLSQS